MVQLGALDAEEAYRKSMIIIRNRLLFATVAVDGEDNLPRAERIALQVRKIIEGIAFASLSGVEVRNRQTLAQLRSKNADDLLSILHRRNMLRLPEAQRFGPPKEGFRAVMEGGAGAAVGLDLDVAVLKEIFSRASRLVHERHPERLTSTDVAKELKALEEDAHRLTEWLWLRTMFLRDDMILVQMGQFGTSSFFLKLSREGADSLKT